MTLFLTVNMLICFLDPTELPVPKEIGLILFIFGGFVFVYVLLYLRTGILGETEPNLHNLITKGPYKFCRHPLYLSFTIMILGIDLVFRSIVGLVFTFTLSIPSSIYRARVEDQLLKKEFGETWKNYADKVGFLSPKLRKHRENV